MFCDENNVGPEGVVPHISGQENNSKSKFKICSIFRCFQFRILCLPRYITRAFHKMAGGHDVRKCTQTEELHDIVIAQT
jgi:hypothetical protein